MERDPTAFEMRVFEATQCIPRGKIATYGTIGKIIGCRSPRAIGQALSRCFMGPEVPCHRVISGDLTIGGFGNETAGPEIRRKLKQLEAEGVRFVNGKLADEKRVWNG
jgi:O-6-methylguanine DNA methyltransferase